MVDWTEEIRVNDAVLDFFELAKDLNEWNDVKGMAFSAQKHIFLVNAVFLLTYDHLIWTGNSIFILIRLDLLLLVFPLKAVPSRRTCQAQGESQVIQPPDQL